MPAWNKHIGILLLLFNACAQHVNAQEIRIPVLALPDLSPWETREFSGKTQYKITTLDQQTVLTAVSRGVASGLYRKIEINLLETPYLHWSWRIENTLEGNDEKTRDGDDYPARVYIILSGGIFFWRTKALNYVWSSHQPKGSYWPNAYTDNAMMLSVRSGNMQIDSWVKERRNVLQDIKKYLDSDDVTQVDAIAIMTDTDNTKQSAKAYYGDIYFSNQ